MTVLNEDCIMNILGHIKSCWKYDYPTGKTLENAFFEGLKPFYSDAKSLGSSFTIVDAGKEQDGFDLKGCKVLGHLGRSVKSSNHEKNIFIKQQVPNFGSVTVRIPQSVITQVRRPKVDLQKFSGNAETILQEQIKEYQNFAFNSTQKDGYKNLYSIVLLYGIDEKKGLKSIFLTVEEFSLPEIVKYNIGTKENNTPCSYQAININNEVVFLLSSFNQGSSNFYKRFQTTNGILITWPMEEKEQIIFTKKDLEKTCAITEFFKSNS